MSDFENLPIIGDLKNIVLNELNFSFVSGVPRAESQDVHVDIKINYEVGINSDSYTDYFVSIIIIGTGNLPNDGGTLYEAVCKGTGYYTSDKSFKKHKDKMLSYAINRGSLQVYPVVRNYFIETLAKNDIKLPNFPWEYNSKDLSKNLSKINNAAIEKKRKATKAVE